MIGNPQILDGGRGRYIKSDFCCKRWVGGVLNNIEQRANSRFFRRSCVLSGGDTSVGCENGVQKV